MWGGTGDVTQDQTLEAWCHVKEAGGSLRGMGSQRRCEAGKCWGEMGVDEQV